MEETGELAELVERVAALDIGKAALTACIRVPHEDKPGRRCQEVREYATTTRALLALADRLRCQGVTLVVMEATSDYWKPPYYLLEAEGFECRLLNARRLVCPARGCRQTFREQVPGVLERYQRRTSRLTAQAGAVARDSSCPGDGRTCTAGG